MVSHVATEDKVSQIISLGASDYLLKPLQYNRAIKRLLDAAERILQYRPAEDGDPSGRKVRVLIADSDADFRSIAKRALEGDFAVKTARSLAETLVHLLRWKPSAVFLSPAVPGLDVETLSAPMESLAGRDKPILPARRARFSPGSAGAWKPLCRRGAQELYCRELRFPGRRTGSWRSPDSSRSEALG